MRLDLLYVYGDDDTPAYVVKDRPADFEKLLADFNRHFEDADGGDREHLGDFLSARGVELFAVARGVGGHVFALDDYLPDRGDE